VLAVFASSHNQNTSNIHKPESFEKNFLFYFSGSIGFENSDIYSPICSPPKRKKIRPICHKADRPTWQGTLALLSFYFSLLTFE